MRHPGKRESEPARPDHRRGSDRCVRARSPARGRSGYRGGVGGGEVRQAVSASTPASSSHRTAADGTGIISSNDARAGVAAYFASGAAKRVGVRTSPRRGFIAAGGSRALERLTRVAGLRTTRLLAAALLLARAGVRFAARVFTVVGFTAACQSAFWVLLRPPGVGGFRRCRLPGRGLC